MLSLLLLLLTVLLNPILYYLLVAVLRDQWDRIVFGIFLKLVLLLRDFILVNVLVVILMK